MAKESIRTAHEASNGGLRLRTTKATQKPFAGRIGGNQEFTVDGDDERGKELLQRQPDAAQIISLKQSLRLDGFLVLDYWKMALIEGLGTSLLIFLLGAAALGLTQMNASPLASTLTAALTNWIGLSLFVFSAAPATGGHLNPSITLATFFAGLASFPRAVIYIIGQCTGAIVGAYWLRLGVGDAAYFPSGVIPGCTVDAALVSRGELFVLEYMFALVQIFLAFGVGLEPRNARVYGPAFAPILVGLTLGIGTLCSAFIKPGYSGLSFNSARCLGLMTAKGDLQYHYIHWLATLSAAMVHGVFYHFVPPYEKEKARREALPCLEQHRD